jgi:hypothetical protein
MEEEKKAVTRICFLVYFDDFRCQHSSFCP